jgi:hypothetical protein
VGRAWQCARGERGLLGWPGGGKEGEMAWWAGPKGWEGTEASSFIYFPYFLCYWVFRFWFINFEIQMSFENFE